MKSERCFITSVKPGDTLARPVIRDDGYVILAENTMLTLGQISRLRNLNIAFVDIWRPNEASAGAPPPDPSTPEGFASYYDQTIIQLKTAFSRMRFFKEVPAGELEELVAKKINVLINASGVIHHLSAVERKDDYTFHHSINVAIICGVLGKWMGIQGSDLRELVLAGLLHDIGKTQIPLEVLNKPGKLTDSEMAMMRLHTTHGYSLLLNISAISRSIARTVLEHHERCDGSGYPYAIKANDIHLYAKIIAVADTYDAMTSDRVYQSKRTPFQVVETISQEMFAKLEPSICTVFLNNVHEVFLGTTVYLSNGMEAEVVFLGRYSASRPVVRTASGQFIDLETAKDISIVSIA